jgi:hypothetical protein
MKQSQGKLVERGEVLRSMLMKAMVARSKVNTQQLAVKAAISK